MPEPRLPVVPILARYWLSLSVLVALVAVAVVWFRGAFNDQGYAPEQPIAFSHKLHAGDMHMDCLFCHFNAERGKHAGVPPTQVCMGCHSQVAVNRPLIRQLTAIAEKKTYTDTEGVAHEGGMVHWNRVHKLPDHVYFSHEWHVKANVSCQTCHGPVETMTVLRQHAPLTMGWCLDCHRRSNYVGGPGYQKGDDATFSVGTANYEVLRRRQQLAAPLTSPPRQVQGDSAVAAQVSAHPVAPGAEKSASQKPRVSIANLPPWRLADLPATHREAYRDLYDAKGDRLSASFMNASTQCSTCHQ